MQFSGQFGQNFFVLLLFTREKNDFDSYTRLHKAFVNEIEVGLLAVFCRHFW